MSKLEKINYSKRRTLENLGERYSFKLKAKVEALGIKEGTFKKGDEIIIKKIILKNDKPHHVEIEINRNSKSIKKIEMSGGVFLNNFINHIDRSDIIEKTTNETKNKTNDIINKKD